jgi:signal transduction histidine kinase
MREEVGRRLAWAAVGVAVVFDVVALSIYVLRQGPSSKLVELEPGFALPLLTTLLLAFPAVGIAIAVRQPWHPVAWIFIGVGLLLIGAIGMLEYAIYALYSRPPLPWGEAAAWAANSLPTAFIYLLILLPMVFPDGHALSPRWRILIWLTAVATIVATIGIAFAPQNLYPPLESRMNPAALHGTAGVAMLFAARVGQGLVGLGGLLGIGSLVLRYRQASGDERQQIKWFAFGAALLILALFPESVLPPAATGIPALNIFLVIAFAAVPVFSGVAMLRYRLYDIDIVLNRAVLFGVLGVFITAVYIGIVVVAGAAVDRYAGAFGSEVLVAVATAIVAIAFQPVRQAAQRLANRLVYGRRATPYDVLASFSKRVAGEYAIEEVLPSMARILAEGSGATRADVWLRQDDQLRPVASWPASSASPEPIQLSDGQLPGFNGVSRAAAVRHDGELLGALTIIKARNNPVTPIEASLLSDLATQAGLVLRNARLIEDLRASRRRIVAAQDARAKTLERNLHDGAQQQLVALAVKAGLVERFVGSDDDRVRALVGDLKAGAQEALGSLRDLAHGIFPPLLAEQGLAAALESQARKTTVPTTVEAHSIGRYSQDVESAVYFCCLEALQNITKYAKASAAVVRLEQNGGVLTFTVNDDGVGFDPATSRRGAGTTNMVDRLEALGGSLQVESSPGGGTTVTGRVPNVTAGQPTPS